MQDDMLNTFQQGDHDLLIKGDSNDIARQEFAKSMKQSIQQKLLPCIYTAYQSRALPTYEGSEGKLPADYQEARDAFKDDPLFKAYLAINRSSQELQWFSVIDAMEGRLNEVQATANKIEPAGGSLSIDPEFKVPNYVSAIDIHCMPGGYVGPDGGHALHAGALYDRGVYIYSMGYMGPNNDDLGRSVCHYLKRNTPDFKPLRILEMGCTVGHSTLPYAELYPENAVTATGTSCIDSSI